MKRSFMVNVWFFFISTFSAAKDTISSEEFYSVGISYGMVFHAINQKSNLSQVIGKPVVLPISSEEEKKAVQGNRDDKKEEADSADNSAAPAKAFKRNSKSPEELMAEQLAALKEMLKRQEDHKWVLVFDLDHSLVFDSALLKSGYDLNDQQAVQTQQSWFSQLDDFIADNSEKVILIYNTSRSLPYEKRLENEEREQSNFPVDIEDVIELNVPDDQLRTLMKFLQKSSGVLYGIPNPDVLITGHGKNIQLRQGWDLSLVDLDSINIQLNRWQQEDYSLLKRFSESAALSFGMKLSCNTGLNYYHLKRKPETPSTAYTHREFEYAVRVAYTPVVNGGILSEAFIQTVSINKGVGLRLAIKILIDLKKIQQGRFSVIVVGDSHLDLPMMRPDLEIEAAGPVNNPDDLVMKEERIKSMMGVTADKELVSHHWLLSINANPEGIPMNEHEYIRDKIRHKKFVTVERIGVLGVIDKMLEAKIPSENMEAFTTGYSAGDYRR